ncbi:MAG TPA: type II toxin-antitoxin system HicB family antitoxin [Pirellulales bacterium]|jgi:antitoxin HicB|nr:type II toxin-antitoxin system HicB family antitoxin [Pirellulales bacterium]
MTKIAYTVIDRNLVLTLEPAEEGGYVVTSPVDPELVTEADSIEEAFANARDALKELQKSRAKLAKRFALERRSKKARM